jgi:hypothetical protein
MNQMFKIAVAVGFRYALPTLTREERADGTRVAISRQFNSKQQAFLDAGSAFAAPLSSIETNTRLRRILVNSEPGCTYYL